MEQELENVVKAIGPSLQNPNLGFIKLVSDSDGIRNKDL